MNGKRTFMFGIAVALVLPLSFYMLAKVLRKDKLEMPVYYQVDQKLSSTEAMKRVKRGELKPVADLEAVNQFGDQVSLSKDLPGKMLIVSFFTTNCTSSCRAKMQQIKMLQYAFRRTPSSRNDTTVQFISISLDPAHDSVEVLREYAKELGVDQNGWWFLTGDKVSIYAWARRQLFLDVPAVEGDMEATIHSKTLVLIDKDHFIRGYFDGVDSMSVGRCANDMGLLAMEKKHK